MQSVRFPVYTMAGAVSGAAFAGLGAAVLHRADPDQFQRAGATMAGLVGGGATHAVYGAIAAFAPPYELRREAVHLGASTTLSVLSVLVGGALLGAAGYHHHPSPWREVACSALGATILGGAALVGTGVSVLCCCRWPQWISQVRGDGGLGERLLAGPAPADAER